MSTCPRCASVMLSTLRHDTIAFTLQAPRPMRLKSLGGNATVSLSTGSHVRSKHTHVVRVAADIETGGRLSCLSSAQFLARY